MKLGAILERVFVSLRSTTPKARVAKGSTGLVVFLGVTWWALRSVGGIEIEWWWVAFMLFVGSPLVLGVLALEQHLSTHLAGVSVPASSSFRTAIAASAANYLPIPGAALVRVGALKHAGSDTGRAISVAAVLAVQWIAFTMLIVAPALVASIGPFVSLTISLSGVVLIIASYWTFVLRYPGTSRPLLRGAGIVAIKVSVNAFYTYLGLLVVGARFSAAEALLISASTVIASAVGIFPGGLGLREFLSGVLAAIGGADPALAALGAVVVRAVMTVALGCAFLVVVVVHRSEKDPFPADM